MSQLAPAKGDASALKQSRVGLIKYVSFLFSQAL